MGAASFSSPSVPPVSVTAPSSPISSTAPLSSLTQLPSRGLPVKSFTIKKINMMIMITEETVRTVLQRVLLFSSLFS